MSLKEPKSRLVRWRLKLEELYAENESLIGMDDVAKDQQENKRRDSTETEITI